MLKLLTRNNLYKSVRYMSVWGNVLQGPPDPVLGVAEAFKKDTAANKVNLSIGAYRDNNGKPVILSSVKKAIEALYKGDVLLNNEYLPVHGLESFIQSAIKLGYGDEF